MTDRARMPDRTLDAMAVLTQVAGASRACVRAIYASAMPNMSCSNVESSMIMATERAADLTLQSAPLPASRHDRGRRMMTTLATRHIGLIGGLALRAGVFYYEQLLQRHVAAGRSLQLTLGHADVNTVLALVGAGNRAELGSYLGNIANQLFDGGADLVAVTAVAPHLAIAEIAAAARGPVIDVLGAIPAGIAAAGFDRVAVFGNRAVMDSDVYGSVPAGMAVRVAPTIVDAVHATYNDIALSGKRGTATETDFLHRTARGLLDREGAQAILLAGTDLSSFYAGRRPDYPFVDAAALHIDAIARAAGLT